MPCRALPVIDSKALTRKTTGLLTEEGLSGSVWETSLKYSVR
jgi:hypothetical protein